MNAGLVRLLVGLLCIWNVSGCSPGKQESSATLIEHPNYDEVVKAEAQRKLVTLQATVAQCERLEATQNKNLPDFSTDSYEKWKRCVVAKSELELVSPSYKEKRDHETRQAAAKVSRMPTPAQIEARDSFAKSMEEEQHTREIVRDEMRRGQ